MQSETALYRSSYSQIFGNIVVADVFLEIHRKIPVPESLFDEATFSQPAILLKRTPAQVFSFEFCGISKNTFPI